MIQVLIDADNLTAPRLRALLRALPADECRILVVGSPAALAQAEWPREARVVEAVGWQAADLILAEAYEHGDEPLVLASGDGDFGAVVAGHRGPVLVVSDRPASMLRRAATVLDPVQDGLGALRDWFDAVLDGPDATAT
ncbi:MAG TPA: hypothetical protein VNU01_09160 [Egibacteraceae bacterium]|nr:hypothetical protein [Egibacteraceae bacterium]